MWRFRNDKTQKPYIGILPGASTVGGMISSSDAGKLCFASSQHGLIGIGSTQDFARAAGVIGIIAAVPDASTAAGNTVFYVAPILPGELIEVDYSTTYERSAGTNLIATSNIGKYFGVSNTTTIAGANNLDPSVAGNAPGTTNGLFFKLCGFSTQNDVAYGTINSSHLAL